MPITVSQTRQSNDPVVQGRVHSRRDSGIPGTGAAIAAADFALGAGLGTTASIVVNTPVPPPGESRETRFLVTITSAGTGQAQATATATLTFKEAWATTPVAFARRTGGTGAATTGALVTATTTTVVLTLTALPVAADTFVFEVVVLSA